MARAVGSSTATSPCRTVSASTSAVSSARDRWIGRPSRTWASDTGEAVGSGTSPRCSRSNRLHQRAPAAIPLTAQPPPISIPRRPSRFSSDAMSASASASKDVRLEPPAPAPSASVPAASVSAPSSPATEATAGPDSRSSTTITSTSRACSTAQICAIQAVNMLTRARRLVSGARSKRANASITDRSPWGIPARSTATTNDRCGANPTRAGNAAISSPGSPTCAERGGSLPRYRGPRSPHTVRESNAPARGLTSNAPVSRSRPSGISVVRDSDVVAWAAPR